MPGRFAFDRAVRAHTVPTMIMRYRARFLGGGAGPPDGVRGPASLRCARGVGSASWVTFVVPWRWQWAGHDGRGRQAALPPGHDRDECRRVSVVSPCAPSDRRPDLNCGRTTRSAGATWKGEDSTTNGRVTAGCTGTRRGGDVKRAMSSTVPPWAWPAGGALPSVLGTVGGSRGGGHAGRINLTTSGRPAGWRHPTRSRHRHRRHGQRGDHNGEQGRR